MTDSQPTNINRPSKGTLPPANYDELYRDYFDLTCGLVRRAGIRPVDVEDVAMDIIAKFIERDFLPKFDADATFDTASGRRKTKFSTFYSGFVSRYVLQHRDRQMTRDRKEPVRLFTPVGEDGATWVDVYGPTDDHLMDTLDATAVYDQYLRDAVAHLNTLEVRGIRNLPEIFLMVVDQVVEEGRVDRKAIAAHYGVSDTAICHAFRDLRNALDKAGLGRDFLRGVELLDSDAS